MIGILNPEQIEEVLRRCIVGRIGCSVDGKTYVIPTSYAYESNFIYGHAMEGLKVDMMRKNNYVCFEVDNTENLGNWQSVITWGMYEELKTKEERSKGVEILLKRKLPLIHSVTMRLGSAYPLIHMAGRTLKI